MSVWAGVVVVASAWVTMTFAGPVSAAGARISSLWDFDETIRIIVREHNEE